VIRFFLKAVFNSPGFEGIRTQAAVFSTDISFKKNAEDQIRILSERLNADRNTLKKPRKSSGSSTVSLMRR
jgi:hypothetical protein